MSKSFEGFLAELRGLYENGREAPHLISEYRMIKAESLDSRADEVRTFVSETFLGIAAEGAERVADATLAGCNFPNAASSWRSKFINVALNQGFSRIINPFNGEIDRHSRSLAREWRYVCDGDNICFASQMGGTMVAVNLETVWVFPTQKTILYVENWLSEDSVKSEIARLYSCLAAISIEQQAVLTQDLTRPAEKQIVCDFPCPHMSHNLWNVQTGWYNILASSGDRVKHVRYFREQAFFGEINEIYEKLLPALESYAGVDYDEDLFAACIREPIDVLCVKDEFYQNDFVKLVLEHAAGRAGEEIQSIIQDTLNSKGPVVLFTIRLDNRAWIHQEEQAAELFKALAHDYPGLTLILDGLSADTSRGWTTGWMSMEQELQHAERLRRRLDGCANVVIGVGLTFAQSLTLIDAADCFIAPSGSGMAIYKWVCNMPGIAFSNKTVLDENKPYWPLRVWHDIRYRTDLVETIHVPSSLVRDGEIRRDHISRADFYLDWRDLYPIARSFLATLPGRNRVRHASKTARRGA